MMDRLWVNIDETIIFPLSVCRLSSFISEVFQHRATPNTIMPWHTTLHYDYAYAYAPHHHHGENLHPPHIYLQTNCNISLHR